MSVPHQWPGETVVCIASGPSLTDADVNLCRGRARVIVVNDNYLKAPWADLLYACDFRWWDAHKGVPGFAGEKWSIDRRAKEEYGIRRIEGKNEPFFSMDPTRIHNGRSSGFQAINLALLMGAAHVLLIGYDMQRTDGHAHWFGNHPAGLATTRDYSNFIEAFNKTKKQVEKMGSPIVNCTRKTVLKCYPQMDLAEALEKYGTERYSGTSESRVSEVSASV